MEASGQQLLHFPMDNGYSRAYLIQHEREEEGHHHFTHMVGHCLNIETDKNVKILLKKKYK